MGWEFRAILLLPLLATVVNCVLAIFAWRRRKTAVWVYAFFYLMVAIAIWSIGYTLELAANTLSAKIWLAKIEYIGISSVSFLWFIFTIHYAGYGRHLKRPFLLLALIPAITLTLAFTNEWHGLIWETTALSPTPYFIALDLEYGLWFWFHVASSYAFLIGGTIVIILAFWSFPFAYRWHLGLLFVGPFMPWISNIVSLFDLGPIPALDWTPIAFTLSGLIASWAVFGLQLFDLLPIAQRTTLSNMREGIIVLDLQNRIIDINPAALIIINQVNKNVIGQPLQQYIHDRADLIEKYQDTIEAEALLVLEVENEKRNYDLQISPLYDDQETLRGRIFVLRDTTERQRAESQLAASQSRYRLVSELVSDYAYAYYIDEAGKHHLEWVTEAFTRLTGFTSIDSLKSIGWQALIHKDDKAVGEQRQQRLLSGQTDVSEYRIVTQDGQIRWLRDYARPIYDEYERRITHIYGAATDITESKGTQAALVAQKELFESLVSVARATAEGPEIEQVLQNAVSIAAKLTEAELGSLLLLDQGHRVTHSYLSGRQNGFGPHTYRLRTVMERGLAHWVVQHRESALIGDTAYDNRWVSLPNETKPARSALSVPINSGDQVVGVLTLQHSKPQHFHKEYLILMEAAADQMALALSNAQMYEGQHRLANHQSILYDVLRTISLHLEPETVVQTATETITQLTQWTAVAILVYDPDSSQFIVQSASGTLQTFVGDHVSVKDGISGRAFEENQTQVISNLQADPAYEGVENFHSAISIPLRRGDQRIGVFHVESDLLDAFSTNDVQLAEALAETVSLAMDNARAHVELRDYAAGLSTLYTVTRQVSSTLILDDVLEKTLYAAIIALEFDMGLITLRNLENDVLQILASYGFDETTVRTLNQNGLRGTGCEYVHSIQDPLHIGDLERNAEELTQLQPNLAPILNNLRHLGVQAYSGIPLMHRGESIGSLCLYARQPRLLNLEEVSLQMTIGQQIATALANAELYDQTKHQLREQTAIREAVSMIASTIDFGQVLRQIAEQMCSVLDATSAYICSFDHDTLYSAVLAEYASEHANEEEKLSDLGESYYMPEQFPQDLQLLKVGWPTTIHANDANLVSFEAQHMEAYGVKSLLIIPMQFGGKTVAYAEIWESRRFREFTGDEIALAQSIGQQAAIAFENARLFDSVANERSQLQALIQASRDGIILIGTHGELQVVNQTALVLLSLPGTIDEWQQKTMRHVLEQTPEKLVNLAWSETARLQQDGYLMNNGEFDLNEKIIQWLTVPVQSEENRVGQLLILRDVTNERQLSRMREDLVHTIVHDLRNPLSAVNICVEMMAEEMAGYDISDEMREYLGIIERNTEKTTRLVDTILDISRLENGQMPIDFKPVRLDQLVADVLQLQIPLADEDGIQLENAVQISLPNVLIDANLIERVLQNLIDNALKTTPLGKGMIRVEAVTASTERGRRVLVSVIDNGPGIPPDIRDHMFKKFTTGQGQKRRGTGLGLAFCRMVIDAHEENIWVEHSSREKGTTITFSLPLAL